MILHSGLTKPAKKTFTTNGDKNMKNLFAKIALMIVLASFALSNVACTTGNFGDSQPDQGAASWVACKVVGIESSCTK